MAIQFRCPACDRRLSIATRKAGTSTACPNCRAAVTVPGVAAPSAAGAEDEAGPSSDLRQLLITVCVALVLLGGLALALTFAHRKLTGRGAEQVRVEPPPTPAPTHVPAAPFPKPPAKARPNESPRPQAPVEHQTGSPSSGSPSRPTTSHQLQPQGPVEAPAPHVVVNSPAPPPPLDKFGNPVGSTVGLSRDGEFEGKKVLFWCAFENADRVFFHPTNPLWKALEEKGFVVRRAFGKFDPAWLKEADQLWIVSSGRFELPQGITPDVLVDAVSLLPAEAIPSGFTGPEYQFIVRATLDVAFSPRHPLDDKAYRAIEDFVKAGKGLCLLADDEPFTSEADELARRLFGARVSGNYLADKIASVRGHGLTAAEIRKFGGQFEVDDHALLTGVNFLFEGITISHVSKSDQLEVAMTASDGKALLAVSKATGQRVVIDCGFTRYCHGPTPRTSYIAKTPGTVRLAQNIAAYLAGKGAPKNE